MENENPPRGESGLSASREWSEFQRDLETLGRRLSDLRPYTATLGEYLVQDLEGLYHKVKDRADAWKRASEWQNDESSRSAPDARRMYDDLLARSSGATRQIWERSETLRQGARDVSEGLGRAWAELSASFSKAAGRLSEPPPSSSNRSADERGADSTGYTPSGLPPENPTDL
jgi:hypothetical protein